MSGEGSSHAASKKRKRIREQIRYNGPENRPMPETPIVPLDQRVLWDYTLLDFEIGTIESLRMDKFCKMQLYKHRTFNREMLEAMGQRQRMEEFLGPKWLDVLRCADPQYIELTIEFHSTFIYNADRNVEPYTLSFSLGRQHYVWSTEQFSRAVGFYVQGELFQNALRGACKKEDYQTEYVLESELALFWNTIADNV
ncbi:hypothetical protein HanRHA438_Chr10g0457971 [Helianthus annuus]|uniref:Uncharacterized protein n=1 Tax=Helianthus annuus TaxID=4232 RepID=A0A9K3HYP5_HELAN|nr:hypothetical protein HanXRQr2_Chr10g0445481 [Helianthus annuus]KAJ0880005.1 hypothetical protein HanRHA438_Chr10g0457971 [Helianthus annuus]